jgi:hypothetical protein
MTRSLLLAILRDGLYKGVRSLLRLAKFVLPTVFLLALLQHSPLFPLLATWLSPLTAPLGLPGNAALQLLTGLVINKFAGIAGLLLLPLSPAQFFTAAVFLALAHNVIMELLIVWQSRLPVVWLALLRTVIAYGAGVLTHVTLLATGWLSAQPLHLLQNTLSPATDTTSLWRSASWQSVHAMLTLAMYLLPLFLFLELLKQLYWMERLETLAAPLTRSLRLPPSLARALLSGLLLGVATGAGVIEQSLQEQQMQEQPATRRDLWRLNVFLLLFHSLFEDTLMFAILPVPIFFIACTRFIVAWVACRFVPDAKVRSVSN